MTRCNIDHVAVDQQTIIADHHRHDHEHQRRPKDHDSLIIRTCPSCGHQIKCTQAQVINSNQFPPLVFIFTPRKVYINIDYVQYYIKFACIR